MRLFGRVDGQINREDRAGWLSCPFDLAFATPAASPGTSSLCVTSLTLKHALSPTPSLKPALATTDLTLACDC